MDLTELNRRFGQPGAIAFAMSPLGGVVARLSRGADTATVALQGAQVLGWRHRGTEMLWLSPIARLGTGKAVRGGIPVCWPWFGPHPSDPTKPAHGFVRTRDWTAVSTHADQTGVAITMQTATRPEDHVLFPHAADASLTVTLCHGLSLSLTTRNTGVTALPLTQALHTYFRVGEIANVRVDGLSGCHYIDKLDDVEPGKRQSGSITFDCELDRIYLGRTEAITLMYDQSTQRQLTVESEGSASAIVWNPWVEKTARLGDMGGPNAYRHMVCIETANAGDDTRTLAPGESHTLSARYRIV